jgi:arsenate reductase
MDIVITVCDSAAKEMCPIWPGHPVQVHWGFKDPSVVTGTSNEMRASFDEVKEKLQNKIEKMIKLPLDRLDVKTLKIKLREIYDNE